MKVTGPELITDTFMLGFYPTSILLKQIYTEKTQTALDMQDIYIRAFVIWKNR